MAGISDYADLMVAVSEQTGHGDFSHLYPRFVLMAEARLSRLLRLGSEEASTTITTDANGEASLPATFREARAVRLSGGTRATLYGGAVQALEADYPDAGQAVAFAIVGSKLRLYPRMASQAVTLEYYTGIPALNASNLTNALLLKHPDLYLYAVAREVFAWKRDIEAVTLTEGLLDRAVAEVAAEDERARWGLSTVRLPGVIA